MKKIQENNIKFFSLGATCLLVAFSAYGNESPRDKLLIGNFNGAPLSYVSYAAEAETKKEKIEKKENSGFVEEAIESVRKKFSPSLIKGLRYGK